MSSLGKFFRLALTLIFIFSLVPMAVLQEATPAEATPGWMKYPGNMTLNDTYVIDSCVIKDGATYRMWYTHLSFDMSVSNLFTDMKGLNIGSVVTALQNNQFDGFLNNLSTINSTALWTILNGMRTVIGCAESTDGKNWTVDNSNVLGTSGSFTNSVGFPSVVKVGSTYKMWYTSVQSTLNSTTLSSIFTGMASATESDRQNAFNALLNSTYTVINYTSTTSANGSSGWASPTTALGLTGGSAWSLFNSVGAPSVILDGSTYKMWYTHLKTNFDSTALYNILTKVQAGTASMSDLMGILNSSAMVIGYAQDTSGGHDGSTFGVVNDKVIPGSSIPAPAFWQSAADPCVIKTGSSYEVWYSNGVTNLNTATFSNVINQIKTLNIPALWTSLQTKSLADFLVDLSHTNTAGLQAVLTGTSATIGYATSTDGTSWTVQNSSEITGATITPWSSVGGPSVVESLSQSEMWFTQGIPALNMQNVIDRVLGVTVSLGYASTRVLTSLVISAPTSSVASGNTVQFTATGTFSDSTTADLTSAPGIIWSSSNTSKATINTSGLATGLAVGATTITATYGTVTSNALSLNVTSSVLTSITVTPASGSNPSVPLIKTKQYYATGHYSDLSTADITNLVSWTSSNPAIATIGAATGLSQSVAAGGPVTITATFGSISGTSTLTVTSAVYDYLLITPANPSVAQGDTLQLSAIAYSTDGTWTDQTASATWSNDVSGNATVSNTGGTKGQVTGVNASTTATITATYGSGTYTSGGNTATTSVTVTPARLVDFRIAAASPTSVAAGLTSAAITLEGAYSNAPATYVSIASTSATWASLSTSIATIATNGAVTGVVPGTATIRATYLGFTAFETFTVNAPVLTGINVLPTNPKITHPNTLQFSAIGVYSDSSTAPLTSGITWTSGTPGKATIDASAGLATTVAPGTSTITATVGSVSGSTLLTVTSATLTSIAVTPSAPSVAKGRTQQFVATGTYSDTSTAVITSQVSWTSNNTSVATIVANTGLATATGSSGTSTITATLGSVSGSATMTAIAPVVTAITVTPANPSVAKGQTQIFRATATYSDGTAAVLNSAVAWATTPGTGTASIVGTGTGTATGTGVGTVTISATNSSITGTTVLTVTPAVLSSITVTSSTVTSVAAGGTLNLVATGTYSDSSTAIITTSVAWSSSNSAIASIAANGVLTSHVTSTSPVTITAATSGISGTLAITVTAATVSSVTVDPVGAVIPTGTTRAFRAIANYSDGTKIDVTTSSSWASDSAHATIVAATGVVTGVTQGTANITATFSAVTSAAVSVTVTSATLSSIAVTPATPSIAAGKTQSFVATGTYSDASTAILTNMVTWSSNNTTVATIIPGGLATSYMPGTATITASLVTTGGTISGSTTLTVTAAVLDSISVTPINPQVTFISGAAPTIQFKATGVNSDGSTVALTSTPGIWASSVGGVATILPNTGLATTVSAGTTNITATTGGKTGTSTLTVLADTVAPVVTITSPTAGLVTSNKNLTVTGNIDDVNVATKQLILNGGAPITLTLDSSGNFSAGVILNNGSNTIQVKAIDGVGNIGQSGTITVKVDAKKPAITMASPADGLLTNNAIITIAGTVTLSATQANVIVNGVSRQVTVTAGAFSTTATLSAGTNVICVTAYDPAHTGDTDYLGTSGSRIVTLDITPPVVSINTPVNNGYVGTAGIVVSGTVDDPAVTSAQLILNGGTPLTIGIADGSFSQNISMASGANSIVVQATDAAGNTSPATAITVTLDTSKPDVALTAPSNNLRSNSAGQLVSGTVNDPSITTVALYINGVLDNIPVAPGGTFSKMKTLSEGTNTIEVRATNAASNTGSSGVFNVIVDTVPPVLTVGLTDPTASVGITVSSNEALSALPTVLVNTTPVVMTLSDINTYTGTYPVGAPGAYTVTVTGVDLAGNQSSANASFTKQTISVDGVAATPVTSQDTTLQVQTNGAVSGAAISVTTTLENPSGNVGNPSGASLGAGAFIEIDASSELQNNLNQIYIQVNYDPTQLPSGTDETTLKLYLWDVTSGTWQVVPGSGVDTTDKYIYGTVYHLSSYGGFGSPVAVVVPVVTPPVAAGTTSLAGVILANGQFTSQVVARSDDSLCSITIQANTIGLTSTGTTLSQITMVKMAVAPVIPTNNTAVGAVYNFGPNGATFSPAIQISMPYADSQIPVGADASMIAIYFQDASGNWTKLTSTVDTVNHIVTAMSTHFTTFALLVPTAPAAFTASNLTVYPSQVKTGEQVTISVNVSNTGNLSGTYGVTLKINNTAVETKNVTLAGGANSTVTFQNTQSKAGTYSVSIDSQSGQFVVTEAVITTTTPPPTSTTTPAVPATFSVSNLVVTPSMADINGTVNISVQVSNSGDTPGTYVANLKINNADVTSKTVTVAAKSNQTVTFTTSEDKAGTYTVSIAGLTGTFTVNPAVTTTTTPPPVKKGVNAALIIGIVGGIIIIAALVAVVLTMRKKK